MARRLQDKTNVDAPNASYPYGKIRDNTGNSNGTPVNEQVYGDFHQFFEKLMADAGVVANGNPENSTFGFQYNQALINIFKWEALITLPLIGNYTGNVKYSKNKLGDICLVGSVTTTLSTTGVRIGTLPIGYRPTTIKTFVIGSASGSGFGGRFILSVYTNGNIDITNDDGLQMPSDKSASLDVVRFNIDH